MIIFKSQISFKCCFIPPSIYNVCILVNTNLFISRFIILLQYFCYFHLSEITTLHSTLLFSITFSIPFYLQLIYQNSLFDPQLLVLVFKRYWAHRHIHFYRKLNREYFFAVRYCYLEIEEFRRHLRFTVIKTWI